MLQYYYSSELLDKIKEKRKLRRIWMRSRDPRDKTKLNKSAHELRELKHKIDNNTFQSYLENLSPAKNDDYSLWKAIRSLKYQSKPLPPIKEEGRWARTGAEKAEAFANHLEKVFSPNLTNQTAAEEEIRNKLEEPFQMALPIKWINSAEVKRHILKLAVKKAPGYDLITAEVLKKLPKKVIAFITSLFNAILRQSYFPLQWKVSVIIMIPKPGKPPNLATSYRPISLLPILSKVLEKIILSRLKEELITNKIIPDHQFGFREKHSTIEQAHRGVDEISSTLERKEICAAAFLDIEQAFDKVWHLRLLYKIKMLLPYQYFLFFRSYLSNRNFMVKQDLELSSIREVKAGVPQGSILGPLLYTIFTGDIPTREDTMLCAFADDTAILSRSKNIQQATAWLQQHLDDIEAWLHKWRIKVNPSKSSNITFTLKKSITLPVHLNNTTIPMKESVKYLGLHFDKTMTWQSHIKTKRKERDIKFKKMYWLLGRSSKLSFDNKITLYKFILKPVWTYGCQLWGTASKSNIEIIQRFQNKTLRTISRAPWFATNQSIHNHTGIEPVKEVIKLYSKRYIMRLEDLPNAEAIKLIKENSGA